MPRGSFGNVDFEIFVAEVTQFFISLMQIHNFALIFARFAVVTGDCGTHHDDFEHVDFDNFVAEVNQFLNYI